MNTPGNAMSCARTGHLRRLMCRIGSAKAIEAHGAPKYLRSDNGPEFIAKEVQRWLAEHQIKTIYIDPGSPWQNGFVESFHGRFRDECLNRELLWILSEARVVVEDYRHHYNHSRPHSKLGYQSPVRFAATIDPSSRPVNHAYFWPIFVSLSLTVTPIEH